MKKYFLLSCILLGSTTLTAQFAPDDIKGVVIHSVLTSAPAYPWNQTLGMTSVALVARTGTTYSTFLEGNNDVILTGINYTYQKQSPNVGAFTVWIPELAEYVTTYYTFTSPDTGTLSSTASIGTISGSFKLYKTWSWQDQSNYWDQATEAQSDYIQKNPSLLGLYNQVQLDAAVVQAQSGLYTRAQLDQAKLEAKEGLYTQAQLDAAIEVASQPDVYFKSTESWTLTDKDGALFVLKIKRSTDLRNWQTAGQAEISFSEDALPAFIKIEL